MAEVNALPNVREWIVDLNSPAGIHAMQKKWGGALQKTGSKMQFAPDNGAKFFVDRGWRVKAQISNTEVGQKIKREMKNAAFWRNVGQYFSADYRARIKKPHTAFTPRTLTKMVA